MNIKKLPKLVLLFILLFLISFMAYFYIQIKYIKDSELSYINSIKNEVKLLIKIKKHNTFTIAQTMSINKKLIHIMKTKQYKKLYNNNIFNIPKKFAKYKHLFIHIVDKNGINRYLSWTKKGLGIYVLNKREDLAKLYKNPHPESFISVGMFDITFKGIMPIYDENHKFLGIVEIINHFNSIAKNLEKNQIYSALVVDKRFTKQLKYPFSKTFVDGYYISTLNLNHNIKNLLKAKKINNLIKIKKYIEIDNGLFKTGYFVTKINIFGANNNVIAYYLIFIKDKNNLALKETLLTTLTIIMGILFILMSYFGFKVYINNINLIKNLNKKIKQEIEKNLKLIYNDPLTKCYSKEKFLADKNLYKDKELVMINIRNFSQINATYGFDAGDKILKLTAHRIESILKRKIYRINADEFIFFTDDLENNINHIKIHFNDEALHLAKDNINIRLTFSFAVVSGYEKDPLRKLNIAIRESKKEPYKLYIRYTEKNINKEFLKFNSYLYDAIHYEKHAKIIPYFQAIRNNKTGEIKKYEALARLEVNGEIYSPYYFIEIAKNSGFLTDITKIMIDKSLKYLSKHSKNITLSINITEDDLQSKQLKDYLLEKTHLYNINKNQIILEILEGVSATGAKNNILQLKDLKKEGFKLSIDDFGVEYSNFERINELDVDFVKIDGKYIKNIDKNEKSYTIAKAIYEFAHSMNIKVVAEFVANESIQKVVEEIGIDFSQGYYFSEPKRDFKS